MTSSCTTTTTSEPSHRSLHVVSAGPLTTVQDLGRFGCAHLGVPRAGSLDAPAAALANRLVGNAPAAAVLETTMGGVSFTVTSAMTIAVTGARCEVTADGHGAAWGSALTLAAGTDVVVGPALAGVRSYVAVAGGIDVEPILGSRSTDTLAFVGPPPVAAGDVLQVGPASGEPREAPVVAQLPDTVVLRYDVAPRADWFAAPPRGDYVVGPDSNRVGLRLVGEPLKRVRTDELPSEGIVLGAIQVPANGQPLVFLNDHPTTGGYPVVGVVLAEDLHLCAQLRPGARITLRRR